MQKVGKIQSTDKWNIISYYHQHKHTVYRLSAKDPSPDKMLTHLYVCSGGITKSWSPVWTALIEGNELDRSGGLLSTAAHDYTDPLLLHLTSLSPIAMVKLHSQRSMCVRITAKIFPETQNTFLYSNNSKNKNCTLQAFKTLFKSRCQQMTHKYTKHTDLLNTV